MNELDLDLELELELELERELDENTSIIRLFQLIKHFNGAVRKFNWIVCR